MDRSILHQSRTFCIEKAFVSQVQTRFRCWSLSLFALLLALPPAANQLHFPGGLHSAIMRPANYLLVDVVLRILTREPSQF